MKRLFTLLILWFPVFWGHSQEITNDSITKLVERCWNITYSHPDSARNIAYRTLELSRQKDYQKGLFQSHNHLGIIYDIKSNFDSSITHYNRAIEISKKTNDSSHLASSLSNMGLTYWHIGKYHLALEYFYDAQAIFEAHSPESSGMISVYNNIGMIYTELDDFENALLIFNKALKINKKLNDTLTRAAIYSNMGDVFKKQDKVDKAFNYYNRSLKLKKSKEDSYGLSLTYVELTKLLIDQDSLNAAKEALKKCFEYSDKAGNKSQVAEAYLLTVDLYEKKGETKRPIRYSRMALNLAQKIKSRKLEYRSYKKMAQLYAKQQSYKKAYEAYSNYSQLKDSLVNRHELSYIYDLRLSHEVDQKTHEIALLDELRENQALLIEKQELKLQNRTFQLIIIIGLLVIVSFGFYLWYIKSKYKQKQKLDAALISKKEELATRTLQAEINERKRISRDIHDSLGQYLGLCKLQVSQLKDGAAKDSGKQKNSIDKTINMIDHSIIELRNIIHNLSPSVLHEKGFPEAVKELTERIQQNHSLNIQLEIMGLDGNLDYLTENTLYRVTQEILNNILKHSQADNVNIQMIRNNEDLTIMIEDNGVGFDPEAAAKSRGLSNIYTRVENINGKVYIDSKVQRGTIITVIVPLEEPQQSNE
ncbi:MAG: sensor histidine kinase [Bacteroidales bacterium]|nr:sensor histidine kinase [Bacteroidales bacterium]MCF8337669.1 sensor histidine kinase [Bacteroidales bacterium]